MELHLVKHCLKSMLYVTRHHAIIKLPLVPMPSPAFRVFLPQQHLHSNTQNAYKFDSIHDAVALFHRMVDMKHPRPSVVELTNILATVVKMDDYVTPISLYTHMESKGILPSTLTLNILMNCYSHLGHMASASSVLGKFFKLGYEPDIVSLISLLKGFCINGKVLDAHEIARGFHCDQVMYETLTTDLCKSGETLLVIQMLHEIDKPNLLICNRILDYLFKHRRLIKVLDLFSDMRNHMIFPDVCTFNIILNFFCLKSKVDMARELFDGMIECGFTPDVWSYLIMIKGYCKVKRIVEALHLWQDMLLKKNLPRNTLTYNIMLDSLCKTQHLNLARKLFDIMIENDVSPDVWSYLILIKGYSEIERFDEAEDLWEDMLFELNLAPKTDAYDFTSDCLWKLQQL